MPDDDNSTGQTQDPTPQPSPPPGDQNSTPQQPAQQQGQPEVRRALPVDPQQQYDDALQQGMKLRQQQMQADDQYRKESEWSHQQAQKLLSEPMPKMPSFEEAYPQPKEMPAGQGQLSPGDKMKQVLGYLAVAVPMAFALGGGRRGSAIGALEGLSVGMNAIEKGWTSQAEGAAKIWKERNDAAAKYGKEQMDYYKDIIQNRKTNIQEKMELLHHSAEASHDEALMKKSEVDDWNGVIDTLSKRQKLYNDHLKHRQDNEERIMKHLGSGAEYEDYKQHLMQKSPDFRKAVESGDSDQYFKAYNSAVDKYTWKNFLDEKEATKVRQAKEEAKARKKADDSDPDKPDTDDDEAKPSATPQDNQALRSKAADLARKFFHGGQ